MGRWRKFIDDQFAHDDLFERVGCFLAGAPLVAISGFFLFKVFEDLREPLNYLLLFVGGLLFSFLLAGGLLLVARAFAPINSALTRLARKFMDGLDSHELWFIPLYLAVALLAALLTLLLRRLGVSGQRDKAAPPP